MSYKTILVYLTDEESSVKPLKTAVALAQKHDAHLIGLHVTAVYQIYATVAVDLLEEITESQQKSLAFEAQKMKDFFDAATNNQGIISEWRNVQSHSALMAEAVVQHGRCADLIVAGQPDINDGNIDEARNLERFLIDSGRPVLMVPNTGDHTDFGKNITIAWNASRESAHAVAAALPLLKQAEKVVVLWVNANKGYGETIDLPGSEVATCLSRHGINVETNHSTTSLPEVGDEILSRISDSGSDLLVMGAYGRSRLREFIFGGASRHLLHHMTVPVLMMH